MLKRAPKLRYSAHCVGAAVVAAVLLAHYVIWATSLRPPSLDGGFFPTTSAGAAAEKPAPPENPGPVPEKVAAPPAVTVREEEDSPEEGAAEDEYEGEEVEGVDADGRVKWELDNEASIPGCGAGDVAVAADGTPCVNLTRALMGQLVYVTDGPGTSYLYCGIPKNGCTYHLALQNRVHGEERYEAPYVVHSHVIKLGKTLRGRPTDEVAAMLKNESLPKYVVVRNPLRRTLSAYLDKVQRKLPERERTAEHFHKWVRTALPRDGPAIGHWRGTNPHWRPELEFCGMRVRDVGKYFERFRVEEPEGYVDFLYKIVPEEFLRDGWGRGRNISFSEHVLGPRRRTGNTDEKFLKYYSKVGVFDHVAHVLREDIDELGYREEVDLLREAVRRRESGEVEGEGGGGEGVDSAEGAEDEAAIGPRRRGVVSRGNGDSGA